MPNSIYGAAGDADVVQGYLLTIPVSFLQFRKFEQKSASFRLRRDWISSLENVYLYDGSQITVAGYHRACTLQWHFDMRKMSENAFPGFRASSLSEAALTTLRIMRIAEYEI